MKNYSIKPALFKRGLFNPTYGIDAEKEEIYRKENFLKGGKTTLNIHDLKSTGYERGGVQNKFIGDVIFFNSSGKHPLVWENVYSPKSVSEYVMEYKNELMDEKHRKKLSENRIEAIKKLEYTDNVVTVPLVNWSLGRAFWSLRVMDGLWGGKAYPKYGAWVDKGDIIAELKIKFNTLGRTKTVNFYSPASGRVVDIDSNPFSTSSLTSAKNSSFDVLPRSALISIQVAKSTDDYEIPAFDKKTDSVYGEFVSFCSENSFRLAKAFRRSGKLQEDQADVEQRLSSIFSNINGHDLLIQSAKNSYLKKYIEDIESVYDGLRLE